PMSLLRYFRRSLFVTGRHGALEGGRDSVKWDMIHHITVVTPRNRKRYSAMLDAIDLPKLRLSSVSAIKQCFRDWGLSLN
ncbi:MAG: AAA family ATPase, partial [Mesorhizobium sp.]